VRDVLPELMPRMRRVWNAGDTVGVGTAAGEVITCA
jgi:hypothetical protein